MRTTKLKYQINSPNALKLSILRDLTNIQIGKNNSVPYSRNARRTKKSAENAQKQSLFGRNDRNNLRVRFKKNVIFEEFHMDQYRIRYYNYNISEIYAETENKRKQK